MKFKNPISLEFVNNFLFFHRPQGDLQVADYDVCMSFSLLDFDEVFGIVLFVWPVQALWWMKTRLISLVSKPADENKVNFIGVKTLG